MCLSPEWKVTLLQAGLDAIHWSEIGRGNAPDRELFEWARVNDFILFTHDLDFGTLLALSKSQKPSVIQLRTEEVTPAKMGALVIETIAELAAELEAGALITIDPNRRRARVLPL